MKKISVITLLAGVIASSNSFSGTLTLEQLSERIEALELENTQLKKNLTNIVSKQEESTHISSHTDNSSKNFVRIDNAYSYDMLDPNTNINRKQQLILSKKQKGELDTDAVYIGGAITSILNYQKSNTADKFGYLMRHPTSNNQRTTSSSEAVIHSAQLGLTANIGDWTTAYMELLYNPEQSFGSGTITDLNRNQTQIRKGYVLLGNLDRSPYYFSIGKMDTPFGLTDTVNPFTASTVWHAFGTLAYGANLGYMKDGLNLNLMAVQGGAQFRSANTPVDGSNIPGKLNNFVIDANYDFSLDNMNLLLGASYIKGSAYCQEFPITHFSACNKENGAYDLYAQLRGENWLLQAEIAQTEDVWAGTFNPTIPQFSAHKVTSWGVGGKLSSRLFDTPVDYSAEFSRFIAGPDGAPWEKQDQFVLGAAGYISPSVKLFGEYIRTQGYAPLNFLSGGNLGAGQTHSDADAHSDVLMLGVNAAF